MASSVRSLSDHYSILEVAPNATTEEIVRAFSAQMRSVKVRPDITVARLAQLSLAYETLRDPQKRRNYDASIGLHRTAPPGLSQFVAAPAAEGLLERLDRGADRAARAASPAPEALRTGPASEPRLATFIAASVRQPVSRNEQQVSAAPPVEDAPAGLHEPVPSFLPGEGHGALAIEDGQLTIGRTGATLAAAVIGVAILTFAFALPDRNPDRLETPVQAQPKVTVALPPEIDAETSPAQPREIEQVAAKTIRTAQARSRNIAVPAAAPAVSAATAVEQPNETGATVDAVTSNAGDTAPAEGPAQAPIPASDEVAVTNPAPASVPAAALPLSTATIARTIERIGYGCGHVVSTAGVEGAAGVYKISCSSGQVYRASPVKGRYHFRRWGGR